MNLEPISIGVYVEQFLNSIFREKVKIEFDGSFYILNNSLKLEAYKFWNMDDRDLINDFSNYKFQNDSIGTIFFFLSGYWEFIHNDRKDRLGRFQAKESFSYIKDILEEPVVDILVNQISKKMNLQYKKLFSYPKMFFTQDIDYLGLLDIKQLALSVGADIIKRRNFKLAFDKILKKFHSSDPHSVNKMLELYQEYSIKGTLFFMPEIQPSHAPGGYNLLKEYKRVMKISDEITSNLVEIGIHYDSRHLEDDRMKGDIAKVESAFKTTINSGRAHYLMFDIRKSFNIYEKSGIKYDSTGGFADAIGFRFGTSYPFYPYNFYENRSYDIIEIPLVVMDTTLRSSKYLQLSPNESIERINNLMKKIEKHNGIFTFLWHNTSFYTDSWKDWEKVLYSTIREAKKKEFNFITVTDLIDFEK